MSEHPPVKDWATDFDHTDEVWAADPYPIWDELRQTCPVAHSDRYGGTWLPTRHEDVAAIAYDTDNFTSRSVVVTNYRPPNLAPRGIAPPLSPASPPPPPPPQLSPPAAPPPPSPPPRRSIKARAAFCCPSCRHRRSPSWSRRRASTARAWSTTCAAAKRSTPPSSTRSTSR